MKTNTYINSTDQEKAVPNPRRLDGKSEQSYRHQLGINIPNMIEQCLKLTGSITILDIGGYHALAAADLVELLSPEGRPAEVTIIDLPVQRAREITRPSHTKFIGGNLNDMIFLSELSKTLPKQQVIFMNQVTQYLQDRLGVIKYFFDEILENGGSFYFNILGGGFIHGEHIPESLVIEALENLWKSRIGVSLAASKTTIGRKTTYQYQLRKTTQTAKLPIPTYQYSQDDVITESLIYVRSAYNFRNIQE